MVDTVVRAGELPDWLLAHGRTCITTIEIAEQLDIPLAEVPPITARWRTKKQAFSPTRGLYVPIPPEFRKWGVVPAKNFVDPLMRHLGHRYYVGYLSAAEVHGASHQKPQVFQVVTSARLANRRIERVRIEFIHSVHLGRRPTVTVNTPTGSISVSTPETTVLDLITNPRLGAGLSNIATIIGEMLQDATLNLSTLCQLAPEYPGATAQRAGWMIEQAATEVGVDVELEALADLARSRIEPTPLSSSAPRRGPLDRRWNIVVNTEVESDL